MALRLLDGSPDGLFLVDADGRINLVNRSASTMFGYDGDGSTSGLIGRRVEELVPVEQRDRHEEHRRRYARNPERRPMGTDLRLFAEHRSGHMFPVEISLSPITLRGESQTIVTVRDVTERQEVRARLLLHEDRARIAHDLHDLVIQRLFAAGMSLQSVSDLIDSPVARERVVAVTDELDDTIRAVRSAIFGLGNHDTSTSLASQLTRLVEERSRHLGFSPVVQIVGNVDDVPEFVADQLVATLTEAVSNVARHADATHAEISITRSSDIVSVMVRDNGRGIDATPKPLGGLSNQIWRAPQQGG